MFDSNYLDKGLALYHSLEKVCTDFKLYIFAFDEICENILCDLNLKKAVVVSQKDFETEEMLSVKTQRSNAEYCWTCTPISIEYVLKYYKEPICTYIDADLYFFRDPKVLLEEICSNAYSILLTEHRFPNTDKGQKLLRKNGKYCVEFNSFKNDECGLIALEWWKEKCLQWCYYKHEEYRMGDQKYLDDWMVRFEGVKELRNLGGGVAPWNISQYELKSYMGSEIILSEILTNAEFNLIFYHFQDIRYINYRFVNIRSKCNSKKLKTVLYVPYLTVIENIRAMLKKEYGYIVLIEKHCSGNPFVAFIQKNINKYRINSFSDIVNLKKLRI